MNERVQSMRVLTYSILIALLTLMPGCMQGEQADTEKLLRDAAARIETLEQEILLERKAYSNNCAALAAKFSLEQAKSLQEIKRLNGHIADMQNEVEELNKSAKQMKGYITILQHRLQTIEDIENSQNNHNVSTGVDGGK